MPEHWNNPSQLPPVDCPLLIQVSGVAHRVERTSHLRDKTGEMEYRSTCGVLYRGRFPWTYP